MFCLSSSRERKGLRSSSGELIMRPSGSLRDESLGRKGLGVRVSVNFCNKGLCCCEAVCVDVEFKTLPPLSGVFLRLAAYLWFLAKTNMTYIR